MTAWLTAACALVPALGIPCFLALRGEPGLRLVAVQLASSVATPILVMLTYAFDQASSVDLALTLALLSLPGTLLFAVFLERWL